MHVPIMNNNEKKTHTHIVFHQFGSIKWVIAVTFAINTFERRTSEI